MVSGTSQLNITLIIIIILFIIIIIKIISLILMLDHWERWWGGGEEVWMREGIKTGGQTHKVFL